MALVCGVLLLGGNSWYCLCGNMLRLWLFGKQSWVCMELVQKVDGQETLMGEKWATIYA